MLKKLKSKRGIVIPTLCAWAIGVIVAGATVGTINNHKTGQNLKNAKSIWCNVKGNGRAVCDEYLK